MVTNNGSRRRIREKGQREGSGRRVMKEGQEEVLRKRP